MVTLDKLKQHKALKRRFAKALGVTERKIQKCAEEIVSLLNNGAVTPEEIINYASDENTELYGILDWETTSTGRVFFVNSLLSSATLLLGSDNKLYELVQ